MDIIAIDGFSRDCAAWRHRKSLLIVPGTGGMDRRITGSALTVLGEVLTWETEP